MRLVCVHMFSIACACVCARACAYTTKKIFDQKNILYLELILKLSLRAYTYVHVRMRACVRACVRARVRAQPKKFFDPKKFFWTNFFSPKNPPKNVFDQKKFFSPIFFLHKTFFLPKKQKKIICAETLISPKHQLRRRATFPEGP